MQMVMSLAPSKRLMAGDCFLKMLRDFESKQNFESRFHAQLITKIVTTMVATSYSSTIAAIV